MVKVKVKDRGITNLFLIIIMLSFFAFIFLTNNNYSYIGAHNQKSHPIEMYSLWNNTNPTLDGLVNFNSSSLATEWSGAAIYNLFNKNNLIDSKILIKNDNTNLFIGLDITSYQTEMPESEWGASVCFDVNHNGILDYLDTRVRYSVDGIEGNVYFYIFDEKSEKWKIEETGSPGIALSNSILVISDFGQSFFELSNHRQYEIRIPLSVISKNPGQMIGVGFEVYEDYNNFDEELTWPYVSETPEEIREDAKFWGDLFLCEQLEYTKFSIETNFNIKQSAIGPNNGLFITSGDIDGNADLELIVASNRSVSGDTNLLAIYDFIDNELIRIWSSWTSVHYTKLFPIKGLVAYDFDGDSKDEIYGVGEDSRIIRISEWNPSINDFDTVETVFTHSRGLMGYIAIGDADNQGDMNLVAGDQSGYLLILDYNSDEDKFKNDRRSPYLPTIDVLTYANRIHAVEVADMDSDGKQEILAFLQTSNDDDLSPTRLNVFERLSSKISRNDEDDIPFYGSELTEDFFGHTIIVEDVDNDGIVETILASKNYLRIFGANTFDGGSPPLEFLINDGTNPSMGGGAFVDDFDNDGFNELVFGFNNGTITVMNVTDSGGDVLTYSIEWSNDLGSSPGKRKGFISFDIDDDSETEIIFSDNFGQIFIIGKSDAPTIEISSPSDGYTTNQPTILVTWVAEDDHVIHHFDVNIEGIFINRLPGSQTSIRVPITNPTNLIEITAYDVNGKNISTSIEVIYDAFAPEIFITFPSNNYFTKNDYVLLEYYNFDPNDNFIYYEIYRNDQLIITSYTLDYYNINLPTQGLYNITIKGIDDLGFEGKSSIFITRDYTPPYIDITNPIFGSYVSSSEIDLRWTTSDLYSELSHFDIYMNGDFVTTTTYYHQIISLNVDRYYLFEVFAFDILGNNKSDTVSITKDSISPYVNILSHTSGSIIQSSTINLVWSVSDNYQGSGIQYSEVFVNQESKYSGTSTSSIINLGNDGLKDIQVITYDRAGNSKYDIVFLTLDQEGPYVEILTPLDNYNTSLDFIPLSWFAQDNGTGIVECQILIDGVVEQTITNTATTTFLLPIPLDKSSTITVKAIDLLNQISEDSIVVNQNPIFAILEMTYPISNLTYINENEIEISWVYLNIENITSIDLFVNETNVLSTTDTGVSSFLIDLSFIPSNIYPEINITIAYFTDNINYSITKWIMVDQENPYISIITPLNNSEIYYSNQYIQWTGYDQGAGLEYFELRLNEQSLVICYCLRNYYYLTFNLGDANYSISLYAKDKAGNIDTITITLIVKIQLPIVGTNLSSTYYTQTGEFQLNFNIIDPKDGIQKFQILLDNSDIYTVISCPEYITEACSYLINITVNDYTDPDLEGEHTLDIIIIDALNRENHMIFFVIVDNEAPVIQPTMYFDNRIISNNIVEIEIKDDINQNNHSISITVSDNQIIESVIVIITGDDYYQTYFMIRTPTYRSETIKYEITLNFTGLEKGVYQIIIQAFDYAGNSQEVSINLDVSYERAIPWFLQGVYAIYFALIIFVLIFIALFVIVGARKFAQNRNWVDDIICVLYVKETGLTCVSVNYIPLLIQEEQLIGGAMIAIQGILDGIGGEKKSKIEIMDLGAQSLLISKGKFGLGALIVKSNKPIHKNKILHFTKEFEKKYKEALNLLYFVNSTSFEDSIKIVEKYFGKKYLGINGVMQNGITQQLQEYQKTRDDTEEHQIDIEDGKTLLIEKTPIDELLEQISREGRNQLVKIIEKAPRIIILIIESKFDEAEKIIQEILTGLELLLRIERTNFELQLFIQNMMKFAREINDAIKNGRENKQDQLQKAIENASYIWFQEIAEKWSNIK